MASDVVGAASRPQAARPAGSFERTLQGAVLGAATGFANASGALAEYMDPDDVSGYCCEQQGAGPSICVSRMLLTYPTFVCDPCGQRALVFLSCRVHQAKRAFSALWLSELSLRYGQTPIRGISRRGVASDPSSLS